MQKIYIYNINNITKNKLVLASSFLSAEEKERAERFKFQKDYKLYTAGKIMARKIIGSYFDVKPEKVRFRIDEYDRPHLQYPEKGNFDFNISHSGDFVVLAISDSRVGIDVERIKPIDLNIAEDCFHEKERVYLQSDQGRLFENFYKIWTLKESFIKAIGEGLSCPLKNFYFEFKGNEIKHRIMEHESIWQFRLYDFDRNYKLSLCLDGNQFPDKVNETKIP